MHKRNVVGHCGVHLRDPVRSRVHGIILSKMHVCNRKHAGFVHLHDNARRGQLVLVHRQETIHLRMKQSNQTKKSGHAAENRGDAAWKSHKRRTAPSACVADICSPAHNDEYLGGNGEA